ncbi:Putative RnhA [Rhizopus microsporus]|nr:Putative RnhA [Rhizopus microsporus]
MSKNKSDSKRSKWNSFDWDSLDYEPPVVNATFNALTNDFEVSQPIKQRDWSFDDNYGVQQQRNEPSSKTNYSDEALTVTFRLNLEEPENPVFTKVVDYGSFRNQDIVPDYDDLMTPPNNNQAEEDYRTPIPDVPVNKLRSPYESVKEYLYTHFELMRHDFLLPLREAINGYRQEHASLKEAETMGESMEKLSIQKPFRLYERVQLNAIVFGSRQPLYRISFRLPYSVRVQWAQSKRLMPGSLVLLSKDHFKSDLKIATVVDRGEEEPMKGPDRFEYLIDIYLERDNEDQPLGFGDPTLTDKDVYVMIEATNGYFEAYRHVLKVLQKVEPDQFPFSSYLVNLSKDILIPHYAARKRVYDINVFKRHVRDERWPVDIMGSWPEYRTGMDKTQLDALKTILTRNLSIIQGWILSLFSRLF